jgi:hypothetical protein
MHPGAQKRDPGGASSPSKRSAEPMALRVAPAGGGDDAGIRQRHRTGQAWRQVRRWGQVPVRDLGVDAAMSLPRSCMTT